MQTPIKITPQESEKIFNLFSTYNAYLGILGYLTDRKTTEDNGLFDKKWAEAVSLGRALETEKRAIEKKYKPEGTWDRYEFNFDNQEVVFYRDET